MPNGIENCYVMFVGWTDYDHGTFTISGDIVKNYNCVGTGGFDGHGGPGGYGCGFMIYSIELNGNSGNIYPENINKQGEGDWLYFLFILE